MKKTRTFQAVAVKVVSAALALFVFTQCNDEPRIKAPQAAQTPTVSVSDEDAPVVSLTVDGIHTVFSSLADCKTCDYVVPENAEVVDGKEIGIKPGQAICLDENFRYGNLKLINIEGSAKEPIVIAYNVKAIDSPAETETVN
jgi:hypothetical protein